MGKKRDKKSNPLQDYQRKLKKKRKQKKIDENKERKQKGLIGLGIDKLQNEYQRLEGLNQKNQISDEQSQRLKRVKNIIQGHFKENLKSKRIINPVERRRRLIEEHSDVDMNQRQTVPDFDPTKMFYRNEGVESDVGDKYYVPIVDGIPLPKEKEPIYHPSLPQGPPPMDNEALAQYANQYLKSSPKYINIIPKKNKKTKNSNKKEEISSNLLVRPPPPPVPLPHNISNNNQIKENIKKDEEEKKGFSIGPVLPSFGNF